jgi:hypothetical protein
LAQDRDPTRWAFTLDGHLALLGSEVTDTSPCGEPLLCWRLVCRLGFPSREAGCRQRKAPAVFGTCSQGADCGGDLHPVSPGGKAAR